jgi:crotonobetainyl-CoA:carnitine CoA-transferase CaiB-like acyl-CoA transferase
MGHAEVVARARMARLLVGSVEPAAASSGLELGSGALTGPRRAARHRPRVVDWTVLWAGPWAAQHLRRSGTLVERIEHPRRRDGLLSWPEGRRWWRRLNSRKRVTWLDARVERDRARLGAAIGDAEILLTSMTPRARASLGFDDCWRCEHAPGLLHLELVAFEEPWSDAPGLGEHAAAMAGLLWRADGPPATPYPWADPLLGASALALGRIWLSSERRPGGRVRLTLERAAALPFAITAS